MSKIIIDNLLDETSFLSDVNNRFDQIEDEFNNKVLYRDNPELEPNEMKNNLDMSENDILNAGDLEVKSLTIGGKTFEGNSTWGEIVGEIPNQTDLEARLVDAKNSGVHSLRVGLDNLTNKAFNIEEGLDGRFTFSFTDAKNKLAYGAVALNQRAKIDIDLLELAPTQVLGFMRGDDVCPKPIDDAGIPGIPLTPCPAPAPDYRNPSDIFGDAFIGGEAFIIEFEAPAIDGKMNLIDPSNPLGNLIPTDLIQGDGVIFLEALILPSGKMVVQEGWHKWSQAVVVSTASATSYNPASDLVIEPNSTNVDLAVKDLDLVVDANRTHTTEIDNPHSVTWDQTGAEEANSGLVPHLTDINNPHGVNKGHVGLGNADNTSDIAKPISSATQAALDGKLPSTQFATDTVGGIIKVAYNASTNTLNISTS